MSLSGIKMPPLDWDKVMGANIDALREDLDAAENMYELLEMVGIFFRVTYFWSLVLLKMQAFDFFQLFFTRHW